MSQSHQTPVLDASSRMWRRTIIGILVFVVALALFLVSGVQDMVTVEKLRSLGDEPLAAIFIIIAMTGAWTFALPGSIFFFVTPLLFPPLEAAAIITAGSMTGTSAGYAAARFIGGPWVEQFRASRWTQFLARHSTFGMIFTLRIVPASQHGILNYSAGLLKVNFLRFLGATMIAIAFKGFLYATAIQQSVNASNVREALNAETVASLFGLAVLGITGHLVQKRLEKRDNESTRG